MKKADFCVIATLFVVGCGSADDEQPLSYVEREPVPGCEHVTPARCDIRETRCQNDLFALASCMRDDAAASVPPIRVLSANEFRSELEAELSGVEVPGINHFERALTLLGLAQAGSFAPSNVLGEFVDSVAAVYSSDEKQVTVIDRGQGTDSDAANSVLLHEFVHALQDQTQGLSFDVQAESFDRRLARTCLVEGEAELYQLLMDAALLGVKTEPLDLKKAFYSGAINRENWLHEQASPYHAARAALAYGFGAHFAYLAFRQGGSEQVKALYQPLPLTMQRILASEDSVAPEPETVAITLPEVDAPLEVFAEEQLGAAGVLMFAAKIGAAGAAREVAKAWRGDLLRVYSSGERTGLMWRIAFASDDVATKFASDVGVWNEAQVLTERAANVVAIVASADTQLRNSLKSLLRPAQ